ncbi:DUF58 domain-containing protein [Halobellus sp. GM3]|uniref:DUF58 domain-containing protein n=1 Tax=Halobellus sp. GM3 TaxID=3458410 RepID=UPI00403E2A2C
MRPTRRAYVVAAVIAASLAAGSLFGARALDAVVLPSAVALLGAVVQVWRAPVPTVERRLPPADAPVPTATVELSLRAPRSYAATVRDRLPSGVRASDGATDGATDDDDSAAVVAGTVGGDGVVTYEIATQRRGEHVFGPVTVVLTDVLGLVERAVTVDARDTLVVYPPVARLSGTARADLLSAAESRPGRADHRDSFDGLREYVRGDARRDIHWKSSAKRGELVVQEYVAERESDRVAVAAGAVADAGSGVDTGGDTDAGSGVDADTDTAAGSRVTAGERSERDDPDVETVDAMAEAAASVCLSLLDDGRPVRLETPSGSVEASPGSTRALFEHLATAGGGPVPIGGAAANGRGGSETPVDADIVIRASNGSATVRVADRERRFEELIGDARAARAGTGAAQVPHAGFEDTRPEGSRPGDAPGSTTTGAER